MRFPWLLRGFSIAAALAIIACAADPITPVPAAPSASETPTDASAPRVAPTVAAQPTPQATLPPTTAATTARTPPPTTRAPALPASTPTPGSPPTPVLPQAAEPTPVLIRLRDNLDDPLGYCIDVRGFGAGIRLDADLQAHSCKSSSADDQSFAMIGDPQGGSILLVQYDVCLAVVDMEPGASIFLRPCDRGPASRVFEWLDDGRLRLLVEPDASQAQLCVGVADGDGEPAGGRNHLRRDLLLVDCQEAEPALIRWDPQK